MANEKIFDIHRIAKGMRRLNEMKEEIKLIFLSLRRYFLDIANEAVSHHRSNRPGPWLELPDRFCVCGPKGDALLFRVYDIEGSPVYGLMYKKNLRRHDESPKLLFKGKWNNRDEEIFPEQLSKEETLGLYSLLPALLEQLACWYPEALPADLQIFLEASNL